MVFSKLLYIFILFITSGDGYSINMNTPSNNINKLTTIKNNIELYIEKNNYVKENKNSIKESIYNNPIKSVNYEKILINLAIIKSIYISGDYDIVIVDTGYNKYSYNINTENDKQKLNIIISVLPNTCKKIVISDKRIMMDNFSSLYNQKY